MSKVRVYMHTVASLSVEVDVSDDLDPEEARERAVEEAYEKAPRGVCAHCAGWGRDWSLDLGEWSTDGFRVQDAEAPERIESGD